MTNQEAAEMIRNDMKLHHDYLSGQYRKALNMAIDALLKENRKPDCEHANHDGAGCLGYCRCEQDDEPIDACKECEKYTGNIFETLQDGKVE